MSDRESLFDARVPQLTDDVVFTLVLPAETEEWAEEFLNEVDGTEARRTAEGVIVSHRVGGNCNAVTCARMWLDDIEDALREAEIDPMSFRLTATSEPR